MSWTRPVAKVFNRNRFGVVLLELLVVVGLIGMMAGIAMLSFGAMWGNLRFKRQAEELVNVFQMAQTGAAETDRRYAVILDLVGQGFILREFKSIDLTAMHPDDAIIQTGYFGKGMTVDYVLYDDEDFVSTSELEDVQDDADSVLSARFLAGKSGWQYGGIVVLRDDEGMPWTLVIHRFAKPVKLFEGEWDLESLGMQPISKDNMRF